MDVSTITGLVGSVGFPIAACIYMAYFCNTTIKELRETIQNNTLIMAKIEGKLEGKE